MGEPGERRNGRWPGIHGARVGSGERTLLLQSQILRPKAGTLPERGSDRVRRWGRQLLRLRLQQSNHVDRPERTAWWRAGSEPYADAFSKSPGATLCSPQTRILVVVLLRQPETAKPMPQRVRPCSS